MSNEIASQALKLARVAVLGVIILAVYCVGGDLVASDVPESILGHVRP